jgi:thiol-disulfide isomerase/thioredoxin
MNNNKKLILLVIAFLCFAIFIVSAYFGYDSLAAKYGDKNVNEEKSASENQDTKKQTDNEKIKAKDFVVYDENNKEVKLSDYIGTPVVLNFWASWCPPCKSEMPSFNEMSNKYSKDKIAILMINLTDGQRETMSKAKQYITDNNYDLKILFDNNMDAANKYNISSIPRTIFIDKEGYIAKDNLAGVISEDELENQIKLLLKD